ncbi:hypothetical protein LTS18_012801, partial [Coniosporium uncinatum]
SVFHDEGAGKFNPSPQLLDEAVCNEWPGREVGVFVSIGTGKRPNSSNTQQHLWYEGFLGGSLGDFAEARRRLIAKIEGCEDTHIYMMNEHMHKRGVNTENYYRLNVEVGVGEFGMNEWSRLSEISTNTRMYLAQNDVQGMVVDAAAKMSRIHRAKIRWERQMHGGPPDDGRLSFEDEPVYERPSFEVPPPSNPMAVELPAEDVPMIPQNRPHSSSYLSPTYHRHPSADEKFAVVSSDEFPQSVQSDLWRRSYELDSSSYNYGHSPAASNGSIRRSAEDGRYPDIPPPLPPKTPINRPGSATLNRPPQGVMLPYPDMDGPPPVNMARKPQFGGGG